MKTAISIPDDLFKQIDRFTKKQHLSRSEFFAKAAARYLQSQSNEELLQQLNRTAPLMDEKLEQSLQSAASESIKDLPW